MSASLNRGVRLKKVSFKVNKRNKFGDFGYCPLNTVYDSPFVMNCNASTAYCRSKPGDQYLSDYRKTNDKQSSSYADTMNNIFN